MFKGYLGCVIFRSKSSEVMVCVRVWGVWPWGKPYLSDRQLQLDHVLRFGDRGLESCVEEQDAIQVLPTSHRIVIHKQDLVHCWEVLTPHASPRFSWNDSNKGTGKELANASTIWNCGSWGFDWKLCASHYPREKYMHDAFCSRAVIDFANVVQCRKECRLSNWLYEAKEINPLVHPLL